MVNFTKIFGLAGTALVFAGMAFGQQATCAAPTATTNIIRAEGTAELVANVSFVCTSAAGQAAGIGINSQVFLSPALPVTSRVVVSGTSQTEATLTITNSTSGLTSVILGTVSGSTINFSGQTPPTTALAAGGTLTFTISNVRINATSLSVGSGVPPSVSETIFVSGPSVIPAALASSTVAFAQNGLGSLKIFKSYTTIASTGLNPTVSFPNVTVGGAASGANNFVICNAYSPKSGGISPASTTSGVSLAAVVEVNENFAQAFRSAATETAAETVYGSGANVGNLNAVGACVAPTCTTTTSGNSVISTRVKLNFANVPANVSVMLPTAGILSQNGGVANLQWVTSDTNTTSKGSDGLGASNGLALAAVGITAGAGSATFQVTADDLTNLDKFEIPVYIITSGNTVPGSATPFTVSASFAPVGSTSVPNFVVGGSTAAVTLSTFNLCTTSLLFPFVTNQLGFDTGIAIANSSTDPFGTASQAGICTMNFYGAGAPSPSAVPTPNVPSGTVYTQVLSGVAAGFQGYIIAQCAFQYAHGFAFITNGVGVNGGLSQGYLAGVIPDTNQVGGRPANPASLAPGGSGETLGN